MSAGPHIQADRVIFCHYDMAGINANVKKANNYDQKQMAGNLSDTA